MVKSIQEEDLAPSSSEDEQIKMAEAVGFEPTKHFCSLVFKTSSIGRSDRPPIRMIVENYPA
jgi:hypothetical protein